MFYDNINCCGCGSCFNICPVNSITMITDSEGFKQPLIDSSKCISCRKCEMVCPILNSPSTSNNTKNFAAISLNIETRLKSSSGGVFPELANEIINNNGYICGAIYDKDFQVVHIISNQKEYIKKMQGAKYSQSDSWTCFKKIKHLLDMNYPVLFIGTPCQVAGLKTFLGQDYETLITVDMICHGVPSPIIWKHYVNERNSIDEPTSKINNINLRSKKSGWSKYKYSVEFIYNNKTYISLQCNDIFMKGFTNNLYLRRSCSDCKFKGIERCSDITLGDYWGVWDYSPELDDNNGTSVVMIHTEKGNKIWNMIKNNLFSISIKGENFLDQNPSALEPSSPHKNRSKFFNKYNKNKSIIKQINKQLRDNKIFKWRKNG